MLRDQLISGIFPKLDLKILQRLPAQSMQRDLPLLLTWQQLGQVDRGAGWDPAQDIPQPRGRIETIAAGGD